MRFHRRVGPGFTLVELLVVITIIGILIALLLPAVQSAREAARRGQCLNNLKQLALALHNYHGAYQIFPPSSNWNGIPAESGNTANLSPNWVITILPFMEQQGLFNRFVFTKPGTQTPVNITDPLNAVARGTQIPVMLCPSDRYNAKPFNGSSAPGKGTSNMGDGWARGNYAANAGLGFMATNGGPANTAANPANWTNKIFCGVMGANISLRLEGIKDGTSSTLLLGEIRAGVTSYDSRGVWAMSGACPSALWAHGSWGDANGPNSNTLASDDPLACSDIQKAVGSDAALAKMGMSCSSGNWPNWQQTARSMHAGGVNVALADGSVRWINDYIDISSGCIANSPPTFSVWDRLNLSNDNQPLDSSKF
jgi:prepilin-type N-terminal cleavage/methylation domain-containing protein/prepilin-type processing-associated H-X9-DG protein